MIMTWKQWRSQPKNLGGGQQATIFWGA